MVLLQTVHHVPLARILASLSIRVHTCVNLCDHCPLQSCPALDLRGLIPYHTSHPGACSRTSVSGEIALVIPKSVFRRRAAKTSSLRGPIAQDYS